MTFKQSLHKFHCGDISYIELMQLISQLIRGGEESADHILLALNEEYDSGKLPTQLYSAILTVLSEALPAGEECQADATRIAPTPIPHHRKGATHHAAGSSNYQPENATPDLLTSRASSLDSNLGRISPGGPVRPLRIGTVFKNQYVLEQEIGSGGMGIVFKARDLLMEEMRDRDPYVAIKVLRPELRNNKELLIALQREFRKAQKLTHPNIIHVMDFTRDLETGYVFLSMQYLHGKPLSRLIKEYGATGIPFNKAWPIIKSMADALAYAHRNHIVHLDFKPANVFISEAGETKVLDFGIANLMGLADCDRQNTVFNPQDLGALTPAYASREMLENLSLKPSDRHPPDARDDIYALACVTYELLTGQHPYGKASAMDAHRSGLKAKSPACLSRRQWRGLQRALAFQRDQRTGSIHEFIKEIGILSPWVWRTLGGVLFTVAALGMAVFFLPHKTAECYPPELSPEESARIKDLLEVAAVHLEVGFLTAPPASNALLAFQEVLKINPCNSDAKVGLEKIANEIEQSAWAAFENGNRGLSLEKVEDGLKAQPNHVGLLSLRNKLRQ